MSAAGVLRMALVGLLTIVISAPFSNLGQAQPPLPEVPAPPGPLPPAKDPPSTNTTGEPSAAPPAPLEEAPLNETLPNSTSHPPQTDFRAYVDYAPGNNTETFILIGQVINSGSPSSPTEAQFILFANSEPTVLHTFEVPALDLHQSFTANFSWNAPVGLSQIALIVDPAQLVEEQNELNNEAELWIQRKYDAPVDVAEPIRIETSAGVRAPGAQSSVESNAERVRLSIRPGGPEAAVVLVHREWLDSRLGAAGLNDAAYELTVRGNHTYYAIRAQGNGASTFDFESFEPKLHREQFGRGSVHSLLFASRPMAVRVLSAESDGPANITRETKASLRLQLHDGNEAGQKVWLNKEWLSLYGIDRPIVSYPDGDVIPTLETSTHFVVDAPHFSILEIRRDNLQTCGTCNFKFDYNDDKAIKYLPIPADGLDRAFTAKLWMWGKSWDCGVPATSMTLLVNGVTVSNFNPCDAWSSSTVGWGGINFCECYLTAGQTNSFRLIDSSTWLERNVYLYYDTSNTCTYSDMEKNYVDICSELAWALQIWKKPPAATYISPADGASVSTSPTLQWNAVTDPNPDGNPVTYEVYVGTTNPPSSLRCNGAATSCAAGTLAASTWHYWQVYTVDRRGERTAGEIRSFRTIGPNPPTTPGNPSPGDGAVNQILSPTLAWTGGDLDGDPLTYTVLFGTANPPTATRCTTSNAACATGWLQPTTTYYWKVQSSDGVSAPVNGAVWSFTTKANGIPNPASNPAPTNGATAQPLAFTATWSSGSDPDGHPLTHTVYRGTSSPPTTAVSGCVSISGTSCSFNGLSLGTTYYWRIGTSDGFWTTLSDTWTFRINYAPTAPNNPSPADAATDVPWTLTPTWSGGDPDGQTVEYRVYRRLAGSGPFTNPPVCVVSSADTFIGSCTQWSGLTRGVTYEWIVVAKDSLATETAGPIWSFTTRPNTLPAVCLALSASDLTVSATNNCVDVDGDAVSYTVNWGDGTSNTIGPTTSAPVIPDHTYPNINTYCPKGTATVTITANDGLASQSDSETSDLEDTRDSEDRDRLGAPSGPDGLVRCAELIQGTYDAAGWRDDDLDGVNDNVDQDGDGLSDWVESQWWDYNGDTVLDRNPVFCPTGAAACIPNPRHKDIYVEMDAVHTNSRTAAQHLPPLDNFDELVAAYSSSTKANPVGGTGIALHIDAGTMRGATYNLGGGNDVGLYQGNLGDFNRPPNRTCDGVLDGHLWHVYDDIKTANFAAERDGYFHYALWVDRGCPGSGGKARSVPGNNLYVEGWTNTVGWREQAFLEELGHVHGLHHGGSSTEPNWKPNYFSDMNYRKPFLASGIKYYGYSDRALQTLNEGSLREQLGFGQTTAVAGDELQYLNRFRIQYTCPNGYVDGEETGYRRFTSYPSGGMDFNCASGVESLRVVRANLNGHTETDNPVGTDANGRAWVDDCDDTHSGGCQVLNGFFDWPSFVFTGLAVDYVYGNGTPTTITETWGEPVDSIPTNCIPWVDGGERCLG